MLWFRAWRRLLGDRESQRPRLYELLTKWPSAATLVLCVTGAWLALAFTGEQRPLSGWIGWHYAVLWFWQAVFCLGAVSVGRLVIDFALPDTIPKVEAWVLSMTTGVVIFVLLMYVGGSLGLFGPVFAALLPALMFLAGARHFVRAVRHDWSTSHRLELTPVTLLCLGFGVVGALLVYLQTATPDAISYDATWSHLTVAEDYAREGRIVPFIASTPKNLPHLASILYTWGFQLPGLGHPALHWMAAQHTEILLFGWTLVGVSAAVAWVLPRENVRGAWAAFFLFPGFYVYDSNLGAAADHVAAFFAIPFLLVSLRAAEKFSAGAVVLSGCFAGALLHTKYQCMYLIAPIAVWLAVRWTWSLVVAVRARRRGTSPTVSFTQIARAPALYLGGTLLAFGPHLLKNWIFYNNPFYPLLLDVFDSTPLLVDFPYDPMEQATQGGSFWSRVSKAASLMFTFSFDPQYSFVGKTPVFGSLFTLLSPAVLFFYRERRLWGAYFVAQSAIFVWAFVYPVDRNLQLLLPWLVVFTASAIILGFRQGWAARIGVSLLVGLQLLWGAKHMVGGGEERIRSLVTLAKADMDGPGKVNPYDRFRTKFRMLGEQLPKDAVVLLHTAHLHLGINRKTLGDWAGWQHAIDYRTMKTPRDVYERYKELGITHIVWNNYDFPSMKQEDVLFFAFTRRHAKANKVTGFTYWEMPPQPPPEEEPLEVVSLGLDGYADGLYPIERMNVVEEGLAARGRNFPPPAVRFVKGVDLGELLSEADAVLLASNMKLGRRPRDEITRCFTQEHRYYGGYRIPSYSVHLKKASCRGTE